MKNKEIVWCILGFLLIGFPSGVLIFAATIITFGTMGISENLFAYPITFVLWGCFLIGNYCLRKAEMEGG